MFINESSRHQLSNRMGVVDDALFGIRHVVDAKKKETEQKMKYRKPEQFALCGTADRQSKKN
jgi:hypothetical protein